MGVCKSLCHSFSSEKTRLVVEVYIFFLLNSTWRFTFIESLLQNFVNFFILLSQVPLDEWIPFLQKTFSPLTDKKRKFQFFTLNPSACFCLKYAQYKNPSTEYYQSNNYAAYAD